LIDVAFITSFRTVPNSFTNFDFLNRKTNFQPVQNLFSFNSVVYGYQTQLFGALQWGKWQAGQPVLSYGADSTQVTQ